MCLFGTCQEVRISDVKRDQILEDKAKPLRPRQIQDIDSEGSYNYEAEAIKANYVNLISSAFYTVRTALFIICIMHYILYCEYTVR